MQPARQLVEAGCSPAKYADFIRVALPSLYLFAGVLHK